MLFKQRPYLILELELSQIRLMVVKRTRYSYIEQHSQNVSELDWEEEPQNLMPLLQTVLASYPCQRVLLSLPTSYMESKQLPLPPALSAEEILETAYLELEQLYPNGHNYYFDFDVINGNELLLVTMLKQRVEKLLTIFTTLNLRVICITPHCAAERLAQDGLHAFT